MRAPSSHVTLCAGLLVLCAGVAFAQTPPVADQPLQQNAAPPAPPRKTQPLTIEPPTGTPRPASGGPKVRLQAVRIEGAQAVSSEELRAALGPVAGREYDFAQLQQLAAQVSEALRARGYPFAQAYLPPQNLADGVLRIAVLDGRYGQVRASGPDAAVAAATHPWLQRLRPGEPIAGAPLERALLLVNDLPGLQAQATLAPGAQVGSGDLLVQVQRRNTLNAEIGMDNYGDRHLGRNRLGASLSASGLATLGDQLSLHGSFSGRGNWLGGLDYSLPLGTDGLRGQAGLNRNNYELGQDFAALGAHGTADVASLGISYPLLRSLSANLRASAGWQHKRLHDEFDQAGTSSRKSADLLPLALAGDYRDDNGVSWGVWTWTGGHLSLDDAQRASDAASARTEGSWSKLNLELARLQDMGSGWSAYARLAAQWASKNLDASEKMLLGGAHGVRAWPSGEATGDEGWLAQMELRWQQAWGEPYAFVDGGHVRINAQPWAAGENSRSISGAGVGLRWNPGLWSFDLALARRNGTREPTSAPGASRVQVWLSAGYRFQ